MSTPSDLRPDPPPDPPLGVRWTLGPVSARGFEALRLSIAGAARLFGPDAAYAVTVNGVPVAVAQARVGELPVPVHWHASRREEIPPALREALGAGLAQGTGWKFAPPRLFPERYELALDNDCILWARPAALADWLAAADDRTCLLAADVRPAFGRFAALCGEAPRNSGIRGVPPGLDVGAALAAVLAAHGGPLESELDEQGLQVLTFSRPPPQVVSLEDVTVCSPFYTHLPHLGRCGAHFVGLNAEGLPWDYYGRPATACIAEHWDRHRPALYGAVGLPLPAHPVA